MRFFLLLIVLIGLAFLPASSVPAARAESAEPLQVDVMTFNIRYGTAGDGENHWTLRRKLVLQVFLDHPADFIGLQEALRFQIDELAAALPEYHWTGRSREEVDGNGEATVIFYRHDRWQLDESETFWLSETPDKRASKDWGNGIPRITTWARFIEKQSGRGVYVFNTHYDHQSQPSREKSTQLMLRKIAERKHKSEPVVITGDFNAGEENPAIAAYKDAGWIDSYRVVHPEEKTVGTFGGFRGTTSGSKIDYVFVQPSAKVVDAAILHDNEDGRYPSDHFPVKATLRLNASRE